MKLLIDDAVDFNACIQEDAINEGTGKKDYFIEGIFLQAEIKNHNKRRYPLSVLENVVNSYAPKIENSQSVGELGHPEKPAINLDRVGHKIIRLVNEGNNYIGKAKILGTPNGLIVKNLMDEKVMFGVSSRGLGSLKNEGNGCSVVQEDYFLITPADIVSDPSGPDCWATAVMEDREWIWGEDGKLFEKSVDMKSAINNTVKVGGIDEAALLELFNKFIQDM